MKNKIILGTVQFGLNYGINNNKGQPSSSTVGKILDEAQHQGIDCLDTAEAYGNAIDIIGNFHSKSKFKFKILSKFKGVEEKTLQDNVKRSLDKLLIPCFEGYSYHSFNDYINQPRLKDILIKLKSQNLIKKIGISIYSNDQLKRIINDTSIDFIQLPYNILDNENIRGSYIQMAKTKNKEIHTRSVFLQGLFFKNINALPDKLIPLKPYLKQINDYCIENSTNIESLALNYAFSNPNIDKVLIGVDTKEQLINNLSKIRESKVICDYVNKYLNVQEFDLLNPLNW